MARLGEATTKDVSDLRLSISDLEVEVRDLIAAFEQRGRRISELENELALCESENDRLQGKLEWKPSE